MKKLFPENKGAKKSLLEFLDRKGFYIVLIMCIVIVGATVVLVTTHNITSSNRDFGEEKIIPEDSGQDDFADFETNQDDTEPIGTSAVTPEQDKDADKAVDGKNTSNAANNIGETGVKSETKTADNSVAAASKDSKKDTKKDTNTQPKDNGTTKDGGSKSSDADAAQKFIMPVLGEITFDFATDKLVYSKTLEDWRTHSGIDIGAERGTPIKAVAKGVISEVKKDPRFGITVIIEHADGIKTVYSNLASAEMVNPNQKIEQGEIIGSVGDTAIFESAEQSHLHFEVLKDNEPVDPKKHLPKM